MSHLDSGDEYDDYEDFGFFNLEDGYYYEDFLNYRSRFEDEFDSNDDENDDDDDDDVEWFCIVCKNTKEIAIMCGGCHGIFCRRDAKVNIHLVRQSFDEVFDIITYRCNVCVGHTNVKLEKSSEEKIPTLEMLCAFNIARKMWEPFYKTLDVPEESSFMARMFSLSIVNSVDKLFPSLPLPIKNLIKRAVFLLGIELTFLFGLDYDGEDLLKDEVVKKNRPLPAFKADVAEIFTDNGASDEETCWDIYEVEWTPQFTIESLDDDDA